MSINWYPGHMAKTRRFMQEDLKLVDVVCEIADARIPVSSRNPDLDRMAQNKRRMLVLNRADQADPKETANWVKFYKSQGYTVMETNSKTGDFRNEFTNKVRECCADLLKRLEDKDRKRAVNYKYFTDQDWGMAKNYDITLDSGELGIETCVKILEGLVR